MKPKILSYGEIIFDLVQGRPFLGGAPLNFAWFINQLGGEATLFSSVGKDAMGSEAVSRIEEYGINNHINISNQPTGTAIVNPEGKFEISYPAAWSAIETPKLVCGPYDLFYFGTLAQMNPFNYSQIVNLVENAVTNVFIDLNLRYPFYSKELISDSLEMANIVKVNMEEWREIEVLFSIGDPFVFMDCFNLTHFSITMGAEGARFFCNGQEFRYKPQKIIEVDPTGAGDAFSAGFVMGILSGVPEMEILKVACEAGASVAANEGAHMNLPKHIKTQLCF